MAIAEIVTPPHPFYPLEANIVGYLANEWSVVALLGSFAVACVALLGGTLVLLRQYNPRLPGTEKATVLWFVLSMHDPIAHQIGKTLSHHEHQLGRFTSFLRA